MKRCDLSFTGLNYILLCSLYRGFGSIFDFEIPVSPSGAMSTSSNSITLFLVKLFLLVVKTCAYLLYLFLIFQFGLCKDFFLQFMSKSFSFISSSFISFFFSSRFLSLLL